MTTPVASTVSLLLQSGGSATTVNQISMQTIEVSLANIPLPLSFWRLGPLHLLAFPGELFRSTAIELRNACPSPLLLATTTQGWKGYVPPASAFTEAVYELEAVSSFGICVSDAEKIIEEVIKFFA